MEAESKAEEGEEAEDEGEEAEEEAEEGEEAEEAEDEGEEAEKEAEESKAKHKSCLRTHRRVSFAEEDNEDEDDEDDEDNNDHGPGFPNRAKALKFVLAKISVEKAPALSSTPYTGTPYTGPPFLATSGCNPDLAFREGAFLKVGVAPVDDEDDEDGEDDEDDNDDDGLGLLKAMLAAMSDDAPDDMVEPPPKDDMVEPPPKDDMVEPPPKRAKKNSSSLFGQSISSEERQEAYWFCAKCNWATKNEAATICSNIKCQLPLQGKKGWGISKGRGSRRR